MTETDYTPHILARLNRAGGVGKVWRQNAGKPPKRNARGRVVGVIHCAPDGAADLTGIVRGPGWRLEVELKGPRTPWTEEQQGWARLIEELGGIYVLCRYDTRKSLEENLDDHERAVAKAIADRRLRR